MLALLGAGGGLELGSGGGVTVVSIGEVAFDLDNLGGLLRAHINVGGVGVQSGRLLLDDLTVQVTGILGMRVGCPVGMTCWGRGALLRSPLPKPRWTGIW